MVANEKWFGASADFYSETIDQSLRFEDGDSPYLDRTPSSASNRDTFTVSFWIKRANLGSIQILWQQGGSNNNSTQMQFYSDDTLRYQHTDSGSATDQLITNAKFRDTTNWYHILLSVDTTQATDTNRVKLYVNGTEQTYSTANYPAQNVDTDVNSTGKMRISGQVSGTLYPIDGYYAEFNLIDGTALDPTSFGESKNGTWIPKSLSSLTYGTNGFRLTFDSTHLNTSGSAVTDPSGSSTDLPNNSFSDASGSGNHFAKSTNVSSTDILLDSPTKNYATANRLMYFTNTLFQGNLKVTATTQRNTISTIAMPSGKWYAEIRVAYSGNINSYVGVFKDATYYAYPWQYTRCINQAGGGYATNTSYSSAGTYGTFSNTDIVGIYYDASNGQVKIQKSDGSGGVTLLATITDANFAGQDVFMAYSASLGGGASGQADFNFGQNGTFNNAVTAGGNADDNGEGNFFLPVPSGFLALCSSNLPDTTIAPNQQEQGSDFNQVVFYDGNGSNTHQITGVGFKPDMVHIKVRNQSASHYNIDSRRGIGTGDSFKALAFNSSIGQYTSENDQLRSLDTDGFTLDDNTDNTWYVNRSSDTYNSWNWRCGSDTPTKTFKVKVVADSTDYGHGTGSNKYQFLKSDGTTGFGTNGIDLDLTEGGTYIFDWSDSSAQSHPIRFSLTNDGTHSSGTSAGSEYTTGVVKDDSSYLTTITLPTTASGGVANLFYYCQNHSGMGAEINTNPITQKGETNFDGTILSVTQVNNDIGMSIATYVAPSGTFYFGHGLSQAPEFFMVKKLGGTGNWIAYHSARTPSVPNTKGLYVNSPSLPTSGSNWIQEVSATRIGITTGQLTGTGDYLLYAWHSVEGYCKVGQYEGNNSSSDNAFVYTGFLPNIVWIKNVDSGHDWVIRDLKHSGYYTDGRTNPVTIGSSHSKNNPHTGGSSFMMDFLSNGFKIRGNNSDIGSSHTFMYIAWASDQTFKFSNAR